MKTIEKAWKIADMVIAKEKEHSYYLQRLEQHQKVKKALNGGLAKMQSVWEEDGIYKRTANIEIDGDHFKSLPLYDARRRFLHWVALFNMNKIAPGGYVTLQVPKHLEGWVKGSQGTNIRTWAAEIGVKRINVVTN